MTWKLSRYRKGDLVEIRSKEEILATLDERGGTDGMPFMPEMLRFCGRRFRIVAVAHKTCDTARQTWKGRRLISTVHLEGARCDGSAHDGCQADCNLFWKDQWLKPATQSGSDSRKTINASGGNVHCNEAQLLANTRTANNLAEKAPRYYCQATEMYSATVPLAWWDPRQYIFDIVTRNHSMGHVLRVVFLAFLRSLLPWIPFGYQLYKNFHDCMHDRLSGRPAPSLQGKISKGSMTPTGKLALKPGEVVRIKTKQEIEATIGTDGKNRGLSFDPEEMAPYCGRTVKVQKSVTKIIDEPTGKMLTMKQPCIMLEGVVCRAEYARNRLNCPRAIPSYWRELWLDRVEDGESPVPGTKNAPKG
jgi:hypothetical protein